jgi:dTDP-4-dehydrorhamnose 3,5-epimerase-like enzyme
MENQPTVPTIIDLPKFLDRRGSLSFIEQDKHVPFEIARTYWVYDVPGGSKRGGHAYRRNQEFIVALSGSFDVVLVNERGEKKIWHMNCSYYGLYIPSGWWRELENFATNSVALVLSSTSYDPDDYIRDFEQYRKEFA